MLAKGIKGSKKGFYKYLMSGRNKGGRGSLINEGWDKEKTVTQK